MAALARFATADTGFSQAVTGELGATTLNALNKLNAGTITSGDVRLMALALQTTFQYMDEIGYTPKIESAFKASQVFDVAMAPADFQVARSGLASHGVQISDLQASQYLASIQSSTNRAAFQQLFASGGCAAAHAQVLQEMLALAAKMDARGGKLAANGFVLHAQYCQYAGFASVYLATWTVQSAYYAALEAAIAVSTPVGWYLAAGGLVLTAASAAFC